MRELLGIYWMQFKTQLAVQFQYRVAMLIWLIGMVVEPVIYLVVWSTVARAQGGVVGSFGTGDFAAYYIVLMIVNHLTFTWIMWEYEYYVKSGTLAGLLLRPIHPIHKDVAENLAYKALTLTVLVPTALVLTWAFRPTFQTTWWAALGGVLAVLLAMALRFMAEWSLALAAFWTTRVNAFNQMYFVILLFFSGRLAPLELFPRPVQVAADFLPFRWMLSFPVELWLGRLTLQEMFTGYLYQIGWSFAVFLLLQLIWQAGVRRFSAVGS